MRYGRNSTRRNRNIGTSASGHGRDNRMEIPDRRGLIWYWRDLGKYRTVQKMICGREVRFVVESTNRGCAHACTVEDIAWLLSHLPAQDWEGLSLFVLRQPKRKEEVLSGTWGRLAYGGTFGRPQDGMVEGPAVLIEAMPPNYKFTLNASLGPAGQLELGRLHRDGHTITRRGSRFVVQCSFDSIRSTQLYRTVLDEIGHWLDWLQKVSRPIAPPDIGENEWQWRQDLELEYDRRAPREREAFANQYADRMWDRLTAAGVIPFERIMTFDGLDAADFIAGLERTPGQTDAPE